MVSWSKKDVLALTEYTDIAVSCGTESINLAIQVCPVVYTGYNESLLILNQVKNDPLCRGTLDATVSPPVVRFSFPVRQADACGSVFLVSTLYANDQILPTGGGVDTLTSVPRVVE